MPDISFLKVFIIFGIVSAWGKKAMEDGRITLVECAELGEELGDLLNIPVDINAESFQAIRFPPSAGEESEAAAPETDEEDTTLDEPLHKPIGGYTA